MIYVLFTYETAEELTVFEVHEVYSEQYKYGKAECPGDDTQRHPPEGGLLAAAEYDGHQCRKVAADEEWTDEGEARQPVFLPDGFGTLRFTVLSIAFPFLSCEIPSFDAIHQDDDQKQCDKVAENADDKGHGEIHSAENTDRYDDEGLEQRNGG